jgi:DNA ligase 1
MPQFSLEAWSAMLGKPFDPSKKSHGLEKYPWMVSEKLDGIRAVWTGSNFYTRNKKIVHAPAWFKAAMPQGQSYDGELFAGRGKFRQVSSTVRKLVPVDDEWRSIQYVVFDRPVANGRPFVQVLKENLEKELVPAQSKYVRLARQYPVRSLDEVARLHDALVAKGAEGLMLRRADLGYAYKRTDAVLKVKAFGDAEAEVVGYDLGKGKYAGKLGSLLCSWGPSSASVTFGVGTGFTDEERGKYKALFPLGTSVTVQFMEIDSNSGRPRHPVFKGIRTDK